MTYSLHKNALEHIKYSSVAILEEVGRGDLYHELDDCQDEKQVIALLYDCIVTESK
jgi:hypothetical protein